MNIGDLITGFYKKYFAPANKVPSEFRRGKMTRRILGISFDKNAKHIGIFQGDITPMKRRFRGVSRTAE